MLSAPIGKKVRSFFWEGTSLDFRAAGKIELASDFSFGGQHRDRLPFYFSYEKGNYFALTAGLGYTHHFNSCALGLKLDFSLLEAGDPENGGIRSRRIGAALHLDF